MLDVGCGIGGSAFYMVKVRYVIHVVTEVKTYSNSECVFRVLGDHLKNSFGNY